MQVLSRVAYQNRLNPWRNNDLHFAHSLPLVFPKFHSPIANELFFFAVEILLLILLFFCMELIFSLLGLGGKPRYDGILVDFVAKYRALALFALFMLVLLRSYLFLLSKLASEFWVFRASLVMMMSIPFVAELMPLLSRWMGGGAVVYTSPSQTSLIFWLVIAYFPSRQLQRQFREAKGILDGS